MKKIGIIIGSILLVGVIAYPVFAHGPGWGKGGRGAGGWGADPGSCYQGGINQGTLTPDQQARLEKLNQDFYNETNALRNEIWAKRNELNTLLNEKEIDEGKVRALNQDLTALKAKMADKRLQYRIEAQKIAPGAGYGTGWGRMGFHRGFGPGMSHGWHRGGFEQGGCWN